MDNATCVKDVHHKKLNLKSVAIYMTVLLLISGLSLYVIAKQDINAIISHIGALSPTTWLIIGGVIAFYIISESLILYFLVSIFKKDYKFTQSVKLRIIGVLFNAITPMATGGQIAQLFVLKKQGVAKTTGASILVVQFVITQIAGIILVGSTIGITAPMFIGQFDSTRLIWLGVIGMAINISVLIITILIAYSNKVHAICASIITFVLKNILRRNISKEQKKEDLTKAFGKFKVGMQEVKKKPIIAVICIILFISTSLANGASAYFVGKDMGIAYLPEHIFSVTSLSVFTNTITMMLPLPGGSGTAEFVYYELFSQFIKTFTVVSEARIASQMIIWRATSFTIPVFIGLAVYFGSTDGLRQKKK